LCRFMGIIQCEPRARAERVRALRFTSSNRSIALHRTRHFGAWSDFPRCLAIDRGPSRWIAGGRGGSWLVQPRCRRRTTQL